MPKAPEFTALYTYKFPEGKQPSFLPNQITLEDDAALIGETYKEIFEKALDNPQNDNALLTTLQAISNASRELTTKRREGYKKR